MHARSILACLSLALAPLTATATDVPDTIAAPGETLVAVIQAVGAQIYECKSDPAAGTLAWQFREPIATLFIAGKTVGRHYAGPNWELVDGSSVTGKVSARGPAASAAVIPLLKLDASGLRGTGRLSAVSTIQRINTKGGHATGTCREAGTFLSVPYTADYAFFSKPDARR